MEAHNTSENGRGAWVALCAHPTHTDTYKPRIHIKLSQLRAVFLETVWRVKCLRATGKRRMGMWMRCKDEKINSEHPHQQVQTLQSCVISLRLMEQCKMWIKDAMEDLALQMTTEILKQCYNINLFRKVRNHCTHTDEVWYRKDHAHTLTSLFESLFCLTKLLNMTTVRNSEAMLGQTLNHFVSNSLILCNLVNYLTCW
jgi:hypothetical protein